MLTATMMMMRMKIGLSIVAAIASPDARLPSRWALVIDTHPRMNPRTGKKNMKMKLTIASPSCCDGRSLGRSGVSVVIMADPFWLFGYLVYYTFKVLLGHASAPRMPIVFSLAC